MSMNFNSIKVQLEQSAVRKQRRNPGFQFHKGTIRTGLAATLQNIRTNFNSIKVQLEPHSEGSRQRALLHFNSIKVQLEPSRRIC